MIQVHMILGVITLVVSLLLLVWNAVRLVRGTGGKSYRVVLVGLIDLQVLIGIITFVMNTTWGAFLLHPIMMLIVAAMAHTLLKENRSTRTQLTGYTLVTLLMLVGAAIGHIA